MSLAYGMHRNIAFMLISAVTAFVGLTIAFTLLWPLPGSWTFLIGVASVAFVVEVFGPRSDTWTVRIAWCVILEAVAGCFAAGTEGFAEVFACLVGLILVLVATAQVRERYRAMFERNERSAFWSFFALFAYVMPFVIGFAVGAAMRRPRAVGFGGLGLLVFLLGLYLCASVMLDRRAPKLARWCLPETRRSA